MNEPCKNKCCCCRCCCQDALAVTKPSINWDHVHPDYKYLAIDKNSKPFLYREKPRLKGACFVAPLYYTAYAMAFASYQPGTCDWKDSLVARPGIEK